MTSKLPDGYLDENSQQTKRLAVVVTIPGLDKLSTIPITTKIRYGDTNLLYGQSGIVYGGVRLASGVRDILTLEGSTLTVGQRLEPEQGRGAVSTMSLSFIDKDGYMSRAISPGVIIPEILGAPVTVELGYYGTSYPEDFYVVFRGRVTSAESQSGRVNLQLSDPNSNRRQTIFSGKITKLGTTMPASPGAMTITVGSTNYFYTHVLNVNGVYDPACTFLIKIDDEWMQLAANGGIASATQLNVVQRGMRGTAIASHAINADVQCAVELTDNAIEMALKLMLSGWGTEWITGQTVGALNRTTDPVIGDDPTAIILPSRTDAIRDYGLSIGDRITITGSSVPANNQSCFITGFDELFNDENRIIYTDGTFAVEIPSTATWSSRSQYDSYPALMGVRLTPQDVDVERHQDIRNSFINSGGDTLTFLQTSEANCKQFIETECYLATACYSLTRRGRLSVGYTKPPYADQRLVFLDKDNVINPTGIKPTRATNNRKFYNEIFFQFDEDDNGEFKTNDRYLDSESLSLVGISSVLPISSRGLKTANGAASILNRRAQSLLSRYKRGATMLQVQTTWAAGSQIESGDAVIVDDNGNLQITNFETGERNIGYKMFEVVDRQLNIGSGQSNLTLISGIGGDITDRYATVGPSSLLTGTSTISRIVIEDSFGALYPLKEYNKWTDYLGEPIWIHNADYSVNLYGTLDSQDPVDKNAFYVSGLASTPTAGMILEIADYPNTTVKADNELYKLVHFFVDPTVLVTTGVSTTSFNVGAGDVSKFNVGLQVYVHNYSHTISSPDVTITDVTGTLVTVSESLGFTPSAGQYVDLIGFPDLGGPYRLV